MQNVRKQGRNGGPFGECSKLAQTDYKGTITWHGISTGNFVVNVNWKEVTTGMNRSRREWWKILWDFTIQCDRKIEARKPDIVFVEKKEREVVIIDVAIPGDDRVKDKELES